MGKYTASGKNLMLNALKGTNPTAPITHVALFDQAAEITGITADTAGTFTKAAHGLANGDMVILTEVTGGGTAILSGDVNNNNENAELLFVVGAVAGTFQLSRTVGGSVITLPSAITASKAIKLVEVTGGSPAYARKAIAFNAPVDGSMDDSTNGAVFDVAGGVTVDYVGYFSAVTAGTIQAFDKVTPETFGAQGTYTLTDADLDLLAA